MTPAQHYSDLARSMTIDQAFSKAYADVRRLFLSFSENIVDEETRIVIQSALEAVAQRLERELTELLYSQDTSAVLARPE